MKVQKVLKFSKKVWAENSFKALVCILSAGVYAAPASAKTPDYALQKMNYDVYASGVHAVQADLELDFTKTGRYAMKFGAETRGLLGSLAPWKGTFESKGWAYPDRSRIPEIHESIAMWQDEHETKTYKYDQENGFQELTVLYESKKPRKEKTDDKH